MENKNTGEVPRQGQRAIGQRQVEEGRYDFDYCLLPVRSSESPERIPPATTSAGPQDLGRRNHRCAIPSEHHQIIASSSSQLRAKGEDLPRAENLSIMRPTHQLVSRSAPRQSTYYEPTYENLDKAKQKGQYVTTTQEQKPEKTPKFDVYFSNRKLPSAFKKQFDRFDRTLYAEVMDTSIVDGMKNAMHTLTRHNMTIHSSYTGTLLVAEIWTIPDYLLRQDEQLASSWPSYMREPPAVHVKFWLEENDCRFHKWLVLPFGGSEFAPPPLNLRVGARYQGKIQHIKKPGGFKDEIEIWARVRGHLQRELETTQENAVIKDNDAVLMEPLRYIGQLEYFRAIIAEDPRGDKIEFIQLNAKVYRRPKMCNSLRPLKFDNKLGKATERCVDLPHELAEFVFTDLGMAVAHLQDCLFDRFSELNPRECQIFEAAIEPLPNSAINMHLYLKADKLRLEKSYRSCVYWRITSLLLDKKGYLLDEVGPRFIETKRASPVQYPMAGCIEQHTEQWPKAKLTAVKEYRDFYQKKTLRLLTDDNIVRLMYATLHYLEIVSLSLEAANFPLESDFFDILLRYKYEMSRMMTYQAAQDHLLPLISFFYTLINSNFKIDTMLKLDKEEGFLLLVMLIECLQANECIIREMSQFDRQHIDRLVQFLEKGDRGRNWTRLSHLRIDYLEPTPQTNLA